MNKTCRIDDCFSVLECVEFLLLQHFSEGEIGSEEISQSIRDDIKEVIDHFRTLLKVRILQF